MSWQDIQGWCTYEGLYRHMAENAQDGAHFVEVGAWLGRSTSFMAGLLNGKNVRFDVVDTWKGTINELAHQKVVEENGGDVFGLFLENMLKNGHAGKFIPLRMASSQASQLYLDNSLDFVFIDADHRYEAVMEDLKNWFPKVKSGGLMAGHDIDWPDVERAVREYFGGRHTVESTEQTWRMQK